MTEEEKADFEKAHTKYVNDRLRKWDRDGCLMHLAWIGLVLLFLLWGYSCQGWH